MSSVPRIGRVLDAVGLSIFLGGGGVFGWAWAGFHSVPDYRRTADAGPWAAIQLADGYWRLQKIGVGLMLAGVAVFVLAWWAARRRDDAQVTTPPTADG